MKNSFYPLLKDFLNEAKADPKIDPKILGNTVDAMTGQKKIEDCDVIYGSKGQEIKVKDLLFEMESAKTAIISQSPLFAPYVHEFVPIYTWLVPTMGTDGVRLFVNPEFADSLTWNQKIFVLLHEIMHCVLLHQERGKGYDHERFNIAADHEINPILVDTIDSFTEKTVSELKGLYDIKYLNIPVEQIYKDIPAQPKQQGQGQPGQGQPGQGQPGQGQPGSQGEGGAGSSGESLTGQTSDPGGMGGVIAKNIGEKIAEASGYEPEECKKGEDNKGKWDSNGRKLLKDAERMLGQGKGKGGSLIKILGRLYKSTVNWKQIFARLVANALSPETEYRFPNKKFLEDPDFPYRIREKDKFDAIEKIIVCVDTSGSMSKEFIQRITDEITTIIFSKKVQEIIVIPFDDGVHEDKIQHISKLVKPSITLTQGGTDFQKPLNWIKTNLKDRVNLCVFFTDGGASLPVRPKYAKKFIWIVYDNFGFECSWGRVIKCASKDM
jgi:predicted metal-dependent peptidase